MERTLLVLALMLSLVGCDLPELSEVQDAAVDGGMPADAASHGSADFASDDGSSSDDPNSPPGTTIGSCDSRAWIASSSVSHPVNPPSYAIDGLAPTRWSSGAPQAVGQYFQIDFGGFVMIDHITIDHSFASDGADDFPHGLDVLVSYDGQDFSRKLRSASFSTNPGVVTLDFPAHAARQLRLALTESATVPWFTIHELGVGCQAPGQTDDGGMGGGPDGGDPTGPSNPNRAAWTATASTTAMGTTVGGAFDGMAGTRWSSGKTPQYGDEWFRLDLGQVLQVSQVWLTASDGDFPSAWELDLSTDDVSYAAVARGLGADVTKMVFPAQSARYVRIRQIGSGYTHWWSIDELTVYQ
jgi:beta-glucosidase